MRIFLRKFIGKYFGFAKSDLKRLEYRFQKNRRASYKKNSLSDLMEITNDLGVVEGDQVCIHASWDMLNTSATPAEYLSALLDVLGPNGTVMVPTFVRGSSKTFMENEGDLNLDRSPSGMGRFSEVVRRHSDAIRSCHPTKSVACLGKKALEFSSEHHESMLPFGTTSPLYKLTKSHGKVIGLGVPMSYLSAVHVAEEVYDDDLPITVNLPTVFTKNCFSQKQNFNRRVETLVHNPDVIIRANPERFVRRYVARDAYNIFTHKAAPYFSIKADMLLKSITKEFKNGKTIYF